METKHCLKLLIPFFYLNICTYDIVTAPKSYFVNNEYQNLCVARIKWYKELIVIVCNSKTWPDLESCDSLL